LDVAVLELGAWPRVTRC